MKRSELTDHEAAMIDAVCELDERSHEAIAETVNEHLSQDEQLHYLCRVLSETPGEVNRAITEGLLASFRVTRFFENLDVGDEPQPP